MNKLIFAFTLLFVSFLPAAAQQNQLTPLERRASETIEIINNPQNLEQKLAPEILSQVSAAQFQAISAQVVSAYGKALKVEKLTKINETSAELLISFEKNFLGKLYLSVSDQPPFLITGFRIASFEPQSASFEDVISALQKLSGKTTFFAAKLGKDNVAPLAAYNADKPFAIGSTFKLYILAELVRQINAGEKKWSDTVELNEQSLPSGMMQNWAKGTPVTLATLASMMISISDNTATDQLLSIVGREKVEKMLATAGNSNSVLSVPFLKTVEMFKIKGSGQLNFASRYAAADTAGKRALLDGDIAKFNKADINLQEFLAKSVYISQIEWFASAEDLARVMNYLRLNSENPQTALTSGILTINKGMPDADASLWNYVGYKGGSETGVISLTYLLQSKKGEWYIVSGSWNDEQKAVDEALFVGAMQKAVRLLAEKTQ